jgi:lactoylglutathione lyase
MLSSVRNIGHMIVLCDDLDRMKAFYLDLFHFPIASEKPTGVSLVAGNVRLGLRKRMRHYDGHGGGPESPGVQIAFPVSPDEVDRCHEQLVEKDVTIVDPPTNQPWGHRTVYFNDPEGNVLEIYGELGDR